MEKLFLVPNDGKMPSLENMPTLLQKPLTQLKKLSCVAGVLSGLQQDDNSTMLFISFSNDMNYKLAMECFNNAGLKVKYFYANLADRILKIQVSPSKILLN